MNELKHYGVLGMKWGRRKGSSSTRRSKTIRDRKSTIEKGKNILRSDKAATARGSGEDILSAVAPLAPVVLFAGIVYARRRFEIISANKRVDKMYKNRTVDKLSNLPKSNKLKTKSSVKEVNPGYPDKGTTSNCVSCTTAMAMREKGFSVKSRKMDEGVFTKPTFKKMFGAVEVAPRSSTEKSFLKNLEKSGDGSYGNVTVSWSLGGAHSLFWKNEKGSITVYDGQDGSTYKSPSELSSLFSKTDMPSNTFTRLDNVSPTEQALALVDKA